MRRHGLLALFAFAACWLSAGSGVAQVNINLLSTTDLGLAVEGPGSNCTYLGIKVTRTPTLGSPTTTYLCFPQGAIQGPTGAAGTSVTVSTEAAGTANCSGRGGAKFVAGAATAYACTGGNGTNGANGLTPVGSSEPAGAHCPAGGVAYATGASVNYVCNGLASTVPGPAGAASTVPGPKGDKGDPGLDSGLKVVDVNEDEVTDLYAIGERVYYRDPGGIFWPLDQTVDGLAFYSPASMPTEVTYWTNSACSAGPMVDSLKPLKTTRQGWGNGGPVLFVQGSQASPSSCWARFNPVTCNAVPCPANAYSISLDISPPNTAWLNEMFDAPVRVVPR